MDRVTREIFRSWNWPSDGSRTYANRPTPYNISKLKQLSPASVYRKWKALFEEEFVRNVYLVPSERLGARRTVLIMDVDENSVEAAVGRLEDAYFGEMIHTGHLYRSHGTFSKFMDGKDTVTLDLLADSESLALKQANLLFGHGGVKLKAFMLPGENTHKAILTGKQEEIMNAIAYKSLYDLDLSHIATQLNISRKTVNRRIDSILAQNMLTAHPILNQSRVRGLNLYMIVAEIPAGMKTQEVHERLIKLNLFGERYLVFRPGVKITGILLYSESPGEIDEISDEITGLIPDNAILTRFTTYFNEHAHIKWH